MGSIITVTFSPCIDKSTTVPSLVPDKKLKCSRPKLEPGGGGINVARAIIKLGGKATAIFPSGGYTGKHFNALVEEEGVPCIIVESKNETRENFIVVDEGSGNQYRFGMPGTELTDVEYQQCIQAVEDTEDLAFLVASGSLPPGAPDHILARLAEVAKKKGARYIVDTSGDALKYAVEKGVYLIKPNLGELSALAGKKELLPEEVKMIATELIAAGKCEVIVVSMGAAGAMVVTHNMAEILTPPPVIRKSTVGAGDSMVAGIIQYLSQQHSIDEAVQYGVACGTAATMNTGTELCRKDDADRLFTMVRRHKA